MKLFEVSKEIGGRLTRIFLRDEHGRRPVYGGSEKFQSDPFWRDNIYFFEYFHGDNGAGLGASHQTGWTGPVAKLIQLFGFLDPNRALEVGRQAAFPEIKNVTPRRETIVTVLAFLVIAATIPFAILDTIETGRVYLFSKQFLEELPRRFTGPGRLRFVLQPMVAIALGIRGGLADAKAGNPPYLFGLLFGAGRRRELLRSGVAAIRNLLALGIIMDVVFQLVIYHSVHPGAALLVGPILICFPYTLSRALTTRLARWLV